MHGKRLDFFKLLKRAQEQELVTKGELDTLHDFRKIRNEVLHGRTSEFNGWTVVGAAHVLLSLESHARSLDAIA